MSTPFFSTPERIAALQAEAQSWLGTPFRARAAVKGAGADCVTFTAQLMTNLGVIAGYEFPRYSLDWAKHQTRSLVLEWLDACPQVEKLPEGEPRQIGDVLCFKFYKCVHHTAVMLDEPRFIHGLDGARVSVGQIDDPVWSERLACVYRPLNNCQAGP